MSISISNAKASIDAAHVDTADAITQAISLSRDIQAFMDDLAHFHTQVQSISNAMESQRQKLADVSLNLENLSILHSHRRITMEREDDDAFLLLS